MRKKSRSHLRLLSEKTLSQAIIPELISCCPSMDLVALGTNDHQVQIYRYNGQEVYKSNQKNASIQVQQIAWKPSGQLLSVAWTDGNIKLIGTESTKVAHQFDVGSSGGTFCVGWASNLIHVTNGIHAPSDEHSTWSELLAEHDAEPDSDHILNLPRDLSHIDIETSLPKLSTLASGGTSEDVFSSRASLDALFRPFDTKDIRAVDVMVVGSDKGDIHLSIYDSFVIGTFKSPSISQNDTLSNLVLHASHRQYSTHSLLLNSPRNDNRLFFAPMDLRFVSSSSDYLSLLASRSSALQNVLRYIHETHRLMILEWESTRDLPGKFLRNVDEDLQEKGNRDIVQALYHSVATGHTFPVVKEWLVDSLAERGHKRWDKAVTSGLQNLKQLVHENLLPALDRCSIILSRFAGIAKFRGSSDTIGFNSHQISLLHDNIACLHLVASKILIRVVDELDLFTAFSAWLRHEIDRLASEGSTTAEDDAAEKESALEHHKVLQYIQSSLRTSPLANYLGKAVNNESRADAPGVTHGVAMFDALSKQIQKMERGQPYEKDVPQQGRLVHSLSSQARQIFQQIADAEKRNVLFGDAQELGYHNKDDPLCMKIDPMGSDSCYVYVANSDRAHPGILHIKRVTLSIEKGISKTTSIASTSVQLGEGTIKDIKFLDEAVLVLWHHEETTKLVEVPFRSDPSTTSDFQHKYTPYQPTTAKHTAQADQTLSNAQVTTFFQCYEIPGSKSGFVAEKIVVREGTRGKENGKPGSSRVLFISQNGTKYKICQIEESQMANDDEGDVEMWQEV